MLEQLFIFLNHKPTLVLVKNQLYLMDWIFALLQLHIGDVKLYSFVAEDTIGNTCQYKAKIAIPLSPLLGTACRGAWREPRWSDYVRVGYLFLYNNQLASVLQQVYRSPWTRKVERKKATIFPPPFWVYTKNDLTRHQLITSLLSLVVTQPQIHTIKQGVSDKIIAQKMCIIILWFVPIVP